jgi:predicted Zn finger-like uncharacterized protein
LAYRVIIRCPDAEDIIKLFKQKHGPDYSRVWRIDGRTIGVFSFERSGTPFPFGVYVSLITLEHDKASERCDITILGAGGSMIGVAELDPPRAGPVPDLVRMARERGWEIHIEEAKIKSRGSQCPNCGSAYVYSKEKIQADGSVVCQNCGKPFAIQE